MSLAVNLTQSHPEAWTCAVGGSLDTDTAPELEAALAPVFADSSERIVFDMAQLKYISSAGIRIIAMATKSMKAKGGSVGVSHLQPQIRKVFEIIQALPDLSLFTSQEEVDQYLGAIQRKVLDEE